MIIPKDIIIQSSKDGKWIFYNVFTRNSIVTKTNALKIISDIESGIKIEEIVNTNQGEKFEIWDIERFSNFDGLLADPTRIKRNISEWPEPEICEISKVLEIFKKKYIIIDNYERYLEIFQSKISLLDNEHIGNFHQQLGQKMLLERKINPDDWWISQKFNEDISGIKNNLYKSVQENFLKEFFEKTFSKNNTILDLGCGVGYYSKLMAKSEAKVIGIDPNQEFIEIAKKNSNGVEFKVSEIGNSDSLDWIEENSIDYVFMSDALLFYFVPPNPKQKYEIHDLLSSIKRILKKNGRLFSLEPHGLFFLRPWFGEIENPFTIITEYNKKKFDITPNLSEIIKSFLDSGYIIRDLKELYGNSETKIQDKRAESFSKEFPLWWFFELEPEK
ncbi:MAG: class I SAM-dependent methyltransferase [Candidatus Nitrosopumilus sp. bin_32a]